MWNPKILEIIEINSLNKDNTLAYLLSLHFKLKPDFVPDLLKKQVNISGIVNRSFNKGIIEWIIPLFDSEPTNQIEPDNKWDWVSEEYRTLFSEIKTGGGGDKNSCIVKMKKFFADNPEVRKEKVLTAAKLYLNEFTSGVQNPQYLQRADYFILKNVIVARKSIAESRLSQYLEIIEKERPADVEKRNMRGLL